MSVTSKGLDRAAGKVLGDSNCQHNKLMQNIVPRPISSFQITDTEEASTTEFKLF